MKKVMALRISEWSGDRMINEPTTFTEAQFGQMMKDLQNRWKATYCETNPDRNLDPMTFGEILNAPHGWCWLEESPLLEPNSSDSFILVEKLVA